MGLLLILFLRTTSSYEVVRTSLTSETCQNCVEWYSWKSNFLQETLNYWKQVPHVLKYFRADEEPTAQRPKDFMDGFLQVSSLRYLHSRSSANPNLGPQLGTRF